MTQIAIQDQTFSQLAHVAEAQNVSADDLAEQIIREHLRATARQRMAQEMDAYRVKHGQLMANYAGQYIAMYEGQVVDQDSDLPNLVVRMDERYPDETVLITQVTSAADETLTFRSPHITPV